MIQWYMMFKAAGSIPGITHNPTRGKRRDKERMRNEKEKERYEIQSSLYLN